MAGKAYPILSGRAIPAGKEHAMSRHGHVAMEPTYRPRVPEQTRSHAAKQTPRHARRHVESMTVAVATALADALREYNRRHDSGKAFNWKRAAR